MNALATREYDEMMCAWHEYEVREWSVECSVCDAVDLDSQMLLEKKGWSLTKHGEFCPRCAMETNH